MKVSIEIDENNKIISCDTNVIEDQIIVDIDQGLFDSYEILNCKYENGKVISNDD